MPHLVILFLVLCNTCCSCCPLCQPSRILPRYKLTVQKNFSDFHLTLSEFWDLGYDKVQPCTWIPTFRRNMPSSSSESKWVMFNSMPLYNWQSNFWWSSWLQPNSHLQDHVISQVRGRARRGESTACGKWKTADSRRAVGDLQEYSTFGWHVDFHEHCCHNAYQSPAEGQLPFTKLSWWREIDFDSRAWVLVQFTVR